jgi:hypothetical protein
MDTKKLFSRVLVLVPTGQNFHNNGNSQNSIQLVRFFVTCFLRDVLIVHDPVLLFFFVTQLTPLSTLVSGRSVDILTARIAYSEHSSFTELLQFLADVKPDPSAVSALDKTTLTPHLSVRSREHHIAIFFSLSLS